MELINRIKSCRNYSIKNYDGDVDSTLLSLNENIGVGDVLVHKSISNPKAKILKLIIAPSSVDQTQVMVISQAYLSAINKELEIHNKLYAPLKDVAINIATYPTMVAYAESESNEDLYLFYILSTSALRLMNNHKGLFPDSGILH